MVELTHMQQLELEKAGLEDCLHRQHMLIMIPPTKEGWMHWKWIWNFFTNDNPNLKPTLWFQLEDTVLLFGTLFLFDPELFPKYEV